MIRCPDGCSVAPTRGRHEHLPHLITEDLTTGLVLMGCMKCAKTEVIKPNRRLRKTPWGFTPEEWTAHLDQYAPKKAAAS